mmetsp:Transcript_36599/g.92440  ORF Transcript_36599/g.92440 Transcript_36599/m.92440 type:complete len:293 (+) Transcript_36599:4122-5000(+)
MTTHRLRACFPQARLVAAPRSPTAPACWPHPRLTPACWAQAVPARCGRRSWPPPPRALPPAWTRAAAPRASPARPPACAGRWGWWAGGRCRAGLTCPVRPRCCRQPSSCHLHQPPQHTPPATAGGPLAAGVRAGVRTRRAATAWSRRPTWRPWTPPPCHRPARCARLPRRLVHRVLPGSSPAPPRTAAAAPGSACAAQTAAAQRRAAAAAWCRAQRPCPRRRSAAAAARRVARDAWAWRVTPPGQRPQRACVRPCCAPLSPSLLTCCLRWPPLSWRATGSAPAGLTPPRCPA